VTEKQIQNQIRDWLTLNGHRVIRVNSGAVAAERNGKKRFLRFNDSPGCCDLLVCVSGGRFAGLEVKTPQRRNEVTVDQQVFLDSVLRCGGIAGVVCGIEDVQKLIEIPQERESENPGPCSYCVTVPVVGSRLLGVFEAATPAEAIKKALASEAASIQFCHNCNSEVCNLEIDEERATAEKIGSSPVDFPGVKSKEATA
jgi:hypothetical protein